MFKLSKRYKKIEAVGCNVVNLKKNKAHVIIQIFSLPLSYAFTNCKWKSLPQFLELSCKPQFLCSLHKIFIYLIRMFFI